MRSLEQELRFYRAGLSDYVSTLKTAYMQLPVEERSAKLSFLDSFENEMRTGLIMLLEKTECHHILESIRNPSQALLKKNKVRYLRAIEEDKGKVDMVRLEALRGKLAQIPLVHATKHKSALLKDGIFTAAELWRRGMKTCANAMDLALGLHFHYVFFTHGFVLENFSEDVVSISTLHLQNAIVSSVDIYKMVLLKNNLESKDIIPTVKWLVALEDYARNLFAGEDFLEIKAAYIFAYFDGDIERYIDFARAHFYSPDRTSAPPNEYPFLGEVKVPGNISASFLS